MAIINCPECKNEVSDQAVSCPHCGYGIKNHFAKIEYEENRVKQEEIKKHNKENFKKNTLPKIKKAIRLSIILLICALFLTFCHYGIKFQDGFLTRIHTNTNTLDLILSYGFPTNGNTWTDVYWDGKSGTLTKKDEDEYTWYIWEKQYVRGEKYTKTVYGQGQESGKKISKELGEKIYIDFSSLQGYFKHQIAYGDPYATLDYETETIARYSNDEYHYVFEMDTDSYTITIKLLPTLGRSEIPISK